MKAIPSLPFSGNCACGCGRREFLRGGLGLTLAALLPRTLARAADAVAASAPGPASQPQAVPLLARPLPLSAVRLTGGPLKQAQDLGVQNLLKFDPDQIMYYLRQTAGLTPKASAGNGSWDGPGRNLTGHIAGHYLSAVSYMYAATGNTQFKDRADYLVSELKAVQDAQGDGYVGALQGAYGPRGNQQLLDGKTLFQQVAQGIIRSSGFDLNGMWSPWYVEHKIFAGLRDAHRQTGNAAALDVSVKFAAWVEGLLANLTDAQVQQMLGTEFGGINESFANLYEDTGDPRWLALSNKFRQEAMVGPLSQQQDILGGKHGNTNVPKLLGELARYAAAGHAPDGDAARFFWEAVVNHHTFATGGHGYDENFDAPDKLSDEVDGQNHRLHDLRTCESCNVYNMVKLTRLLFALSPEARYAEFHERALFNHVLASIDFTSGQLCYMVPVSLGVVHDYQGGALTCCVGTGLENHALHGYGLFYESGDKFWVNQYAPTTAQWAAPGVNFAMETDFPEGGAATLQISAATPQTFTLALRRPLWAGDGFAVKVNGEALADLPAAGAYAEVRREWRDGDRVEITLLKSLRAEPLPDNANRVALMWGPLVLGADLGRSTDPAPATYPSFLAEAGAPVSQWLKPVPAAEPRAFYATGVGGANNDVVFRPFFRLSQRRYGIYWDVYTPAQWAQRNPMTTATPA